LEYIGGDEEISVIPYDKISMSEIKCHLSNHMTYRDSMKLYYHIPGKELANGLLFLVDNIGCLKMSKHASDGTVADVYVEYHGEEEEGHGSEEESQSDFEDEIGCGEEEESEASAPDRVIHAHDESMVNNNEVISYPSRNKLSVACANRLSQDGMIGSSQIMNHGSQSATQAIVCGTRIGEAGSKPVTTEEPDDLDSEDDDYVPHSDDSGEDDEAMELRKFAKEYKKKLRDSEMFVERYSCAN
jgi:hypothetical protein